MIRFIKKSEKKISDFKKIPVVNMPYGQGVTYKSTEYTWWEVEGFFVPFTNIKFWSWRALISKKRIVGLTDNFGKTINS